MARLKAMHAAWVLAGCAMATALVDCTSTPTNSGAAVGPATTRAANPGGGGTGRGGRGGGGAARGGRGGRGGGVQVAQYIFQDATYSVEERLADLLPRMTIEEKAAQMQMAAPAIERLGIPAYHWWNEALHGVARNGEATVFPQAIGMAATWNTDLHHRMAKVIAQEARAKHDEAVRLGIRAIYTGLDMWSPNINIFRDPRWGRGQETYGEDPYLTGRFAVAFVTGLQGDDPFYFQTIATPKHFAVHSGPEMERHRFDAEPSETDLWTTYLPAFEAAVREGHAFSVMSSYNRVDGLPSSANPRLLTDILRKQWGFQGYVTSDVDAVADVYRNHQTAETPEEAAAISVKAGCDLNGGTTYHALAGAVKLGLLTEADLDQSLSRLFTARFRLGLFDGPGGTEGGPYADTPYSMNDTKESDALALDVARQSIVLLKNAANTLPLKRDAIKSVAVIGPTADQLVALEGNYFGVPSHPVTIVQGIRNAMGLDGRVITTPGCPLVTEMIPLEEPVPAAVLYTDATKKMPGLVADYYRDIAFAGNPIRTRVDSQIDFDWASQGAKDPITLSDGVSARWKGVIAAPQTGDYQIGLNGRDGFRMWLDGKLAIDEWATGNKRSSGASVHLQAGKPVEIVVEYFHPKGNAPAGGGGGGGGPGRGGVATTAPATAPVVGLPAPSTVPPRDEAGVQLMWTRPTLDGKAGAGNGVGLFADAVRAAQSADAVVLVLGITADLEREEHLIRYQGFSGGDRSSLDLPAVQEKMLEEVSAAAKGKPVVLVLTNGSALSINWANEHIPAIVEAWYPGQRGGDALADVLFGKVSPAGRLPVTFYQSVNDLPDFTDYAMTANHGRTYRYFQGEVLYPFGYGLSYSTFAYNNLQVSTQNPATGEALTVSATVKNAGAVEGDEVAECYLDRPAGGQTPRKTLVGFARISLKPNEEKTVTFTITPHQLAVVKEEGQKAQRVESAGSITVRVGPDSVRGLTQAVNVTGEAAMPAYQFIGPRIK